ncbi:flagellar hook-associated protein 3 [Pseudomonas gingeri NCPPB 3146 = LMG 5327]|uniref:Flagellar hook-associated protein 3 n=2 Tax=Pseudomonas gingeri TaxID=117681 RepID=A0A7Y8CGU8_9PSED|nr:flagellar hook-associated protein 3 [Pseudomonas gingeri]NWC18595.1 flagellar hook-associated protein 3 [Pseudomonas gingeri]NWE50000.1 flagellar hook-associated protein 3 [Pseudomonas gingeri]PNQ93059.1 flagellar hook-associated protein 3 [Pseudomonas gingeri NCPPB 3146 = LMG 5327]
MRISTAQYYETTAANYQRGYNDTLKSAAEASSLTKVNTAADDPVGAARLLQLGQQSAALTQYGTNASALKTQYSQTETALDSIQTAMQRARELAVAANTGSKTDADRKAAAQELGQLQQTILGLMNSQDSNGNYLFGGSKTNTAPYTANADGTYSYNGDQSTLSLQVGDNLSLGSNITGWEAFQQSINTARTNVTMTAPAVDDGRVSLSNGQVSNSATYDSKFAAGQPYTVTFLSSTQLKITDASGNDVTSEASQNGVISNSNGANQSVNFRGIDLGLNINLKSGDVPDTVIAGHTFTLAVQPDTFNTSRSPGNTSTSVITGATTTNQAAYASTFPNGGAIIKFGAGGAYDLYAAPISADSKPVSSGTMPALPAAQTITAAGVTFTFSGAANTGDQFIVQPNDHQTQNILDTLGSMINALNTPSDGIPTAQQKQLATMNAGISNIDSAMNQVGSATTTVGTRGSAMDVQAATNESLTLANTSSQQAIRDSDPAEVMTRLTLQQTMLQAAQLAFSKISQLGLFNKI